MPLYMIIERFRNGQAAPVYERFRRCGRMAPEGLIYLDSWVDESKAVCFQLMDSVDRGLIDQWMAHWSDLVDFEVCPVMTSAEAAKRA